MATSKQPPKPAPDLRGRDARTGRLIPVSEALRRPATTTVEHMPPPGKGRK